MFAKSLKPSYYLYVDCDVWAEGEKICLLTVPRSLRLSPPRSWIPDKSREVGAKTLTKRNAFNSSSSAVTTVWWSLCVGLLCVLLLSSVCDCVCVCRPSPLWAVWSLGEGQAVEDLDKPIDTPPLSTLLIERPQGGSVDLGEWLTRHPPLVEKRLLGSPPNSM